MKTSVTEGQTKSSTKPDTQHHTAVSKALVHTSITHISAEDTHHGPCTRPSPHPFHLAWKLYTEGEALDGINCLFPTVKKIGRDKM